MIFLYMILGILVLLALLLISYLRVHILYQKQNFTVYIRVGPIQYKVPMQKKIRYRALAKRLRKKKLSGTSETVSSKKKQREKKAGKALEELRGDLPLPVFLQKLKDLLICIAKQYAQKLHIKIQRLHITVGAKTPSITGISYGITAQSTAYLLEFLDATVTLSPLEKNAVQINADFTGEWNADIDGTFKIRIINLLQVFLTIFFTLKSDSN